MKVAWVAKTRYQKLVYEFANSSGAKIQRVGPSDDYSDCEIVCSFGNAPVTIQEHQTWLHLDGAYFGRPNYIRLSKNAFYPWNYMNDIDRPADRWAKLNISIEPWQRTTRGDILICKISPRNAKFGGIDLEADVEDIVRIIKRQTDNKIIIRDKDQKFKQSFSKALNTACAVVTWWSTTGVEAIIQGIPVFLASRSVCETQVGSLFNINKPHYSCNREQWLHNLAYQQWTKQELKDGTAWEFIMEQH